jgi:hydrogenase nickel incorporation protein HypA/HybF
MHELSIVLSIVDIATQQTQKAEAQAVEEIELDIGELSGVEMQAFDFAWQQGIKDSVLKDADRVVNRIEGVGMCMDCVIEFHMQNLYDSCPVCDGHLIEIKRGKELKVKSLVVA